jgi:hypothetical protein
MYFLQVAEEANERLDKANNRLDKAVALKDEEHNIIIVKIITLVQYIGDFILGAIATLNYFLVIKFFTTKQG